MGQIIECDKESKRVKDQNKSFIDLDKKIVNKDKKFVNFLCSEFMKHETKLFLTLCSWEHRLEHSCRKLAHCFHNFNCCWHASCHVSRQMSSTHLAWHLSAFG